MNLSEALTSVYGHDEWDNPCRPWGRISSIKDTPYEAYQALKPEYQGIVERLIGHVPTRDEE